MSLPGLWLTAWEAILFCQYMQNVNYWWSINIVPSQTRQCAFGWKCFSGVCGRSIWALNSKQEYKNAYRNILAWWDYSSCAVWRRARGKSPHDDRHNEGKYHSVYPSKINALQIFAAYSCWIIDEETKKCSSETYAEARCGCISSALTRTSFPVFCLSFTLPKFDIWKEKKERG